MSAEDLAAERIGAVRDDVGARFRLAGEFYRSPGRRRFARGELSFLRWELQRGVLEPPGAARPGSPWWRAVNERLLRDKVEADVLRPGEQASSRAVELWVAFTRRPSPETWYRAHNASIVAGYLAHQDLARREVPLERLMINVSLLRALYAHALVAAPGLAMGRIGAVTRFLGDPRFGTVGLFLNLCRVFPQRYPVRDMSLPELIAAERVLPRLLDHGVICPRLTDLYAFAASTLDQPGVAEFVVNEVPCYADPPQDSYAWHIEHPDLALRLVRGVTKPVR
ncbi:hypothetical protein UO65_3958 [Actinokineospora spheciospongiae]|uniref:Uncharacterized protein n=1 Tax=Actinokineospora spheciospongiae TaxID=909613 RepID=W7IIW2_9PSEU|nr:hypothetical protein [Actinokineospora spheciospongiae]EWC60675.1 hypothetical protein UO65_3958 [Actinokineospora spheciospongiae]